EGHRRELAALVHALERADAQTVGRAVQAAEGLPRLERCADVERVTLEAPLPDDPEVQREVEALREELAAAAALQEANRIEAGCPLAGSGLARAEALGWEPLVAEAALRVGKLEGAAGRNEHAVEVLSRAYFAAEQQERPDVQARAAIELVFVVGRQQQRH